MASTTSGTMNDPKGGVAKVTCPTFEAMGQIPVFHRTYFLLCLRNDARYRAILPTPRAAIMRTSFKVRGQRSEVKGQRSKVKVASSLTNAADQKCIISSERKGLPTSNVVRRWSTKTRITDKRHDHQSQR